MADKKITDLQLISALSDTVNVPVDNTIQTYRATLLQFFRYIAGKWNTYRTISANGTAIVSTDRLVLLDPTSASFTQDLPACASLPQYFTVTFKNIATNGNTATLDASTTELIDNDLTFVLNSDPSMDFVTLMNTGTKWLRVG